MKAEPKAAANDAHKAEVKTEAEAETQAEPTTETKPSTVADAPVREPEAVLAPTPEPATDGTIDLREPEPASEPVADKKAEPAPAAAKEPATNDAPPVLPRGAEAALASILEVVPDPRNTIALTRDPTAEVRLTKADRDGAIQSSGQPRDYQPPAPNDEEWETPKEPAASDRLAAAPEHSRHA
jgi:hypothetical protein